MNERKLALSYLDLNPELRNNLGIIAEEMYRIMEPYRNQSENAVKAMQQAMKSVVLPPDYLKNLQMDFSLPLGEIKQNNRYENTNRADERSCTAGCPGITGGRNT